MTVTATGHDAPQCRRERCAPSLAYKSACAAGVAAAIMTLIGSVSAAAGDKPTTPAAALETPADPAQRAAQEAQVKRRLEALRGQQRELTAAQEAARGEQRRALAALRESELRVSALARELRGLDERIAHERADLSRLDAELARLGTRLRGERAALAALLRAAYVQGRGAAWAALLAPEDIDQFMRLRAYQGYLQRARAARIRSVLDAVAAEQAVREQVDSIREQLQTARGERETEAVALGDERTRRGALLVELQAELADQKARLAALGTDEKALLALLERLRDALSDIPKLLAGSEPFASLRGRLAWPVAGRLLERYDSVGADGRRNQGAVIAAASGAKVTAVSYGRVAYADWLKGYGLIAIVDHGDGYLSLYARCESLLKDVGDWVQAGEAIATAGASGGNRETGLYFELRRDGQTFDPVPWLGPRAR